MSKERKRIVYLLGAGATQAEVSFSNPSIKIQMKDIVSAMAERISQDKIKALEGISNELSLPNLDVEHIITLYESSGTKKHNKIAKSLKKLFREEIEKRINELDASFFPVLHGALIDMHDITELREDITAIITLNYEDLLERALQSVKGGINYIIKANYKNKSYTLNEAGIPILKLHGSFNWKNEYPISIAQKIDSEEDVLWVPPGVVKNRVSYPFGMLWSIARDILDCDILRIIGCSLNRNDWELVNLLYATQKLRTDNKEYEIQLIDYPDKCVTIKDDYNYLNITPILDIFEVRSYLVKEYFPKLSIEELIPAEVFKELESSITPDKKNIFEIWLRAKGDTLLAANTDVSTSNNIFKTFVRRNLGDD